MGYNDPLCFVLEDQNGDEIEVEAIGSFAYENVEYAALGRKEEGHENEVFLMRFHADEDDRIVFEPIESDEEYDIISDVFEQLFNSDRSFPEVNLVDLYDQETLEHMMEDEYCLQDKEGNLFILDENGNPVYLDENGEEIGPEPLKKPAGESAPEDENIMSEDMKVSESEETDHE